MKKRDIGYAVDILLACNEVIEFGIGKDENAFVQDSMYQAAVIRKLEVIGEVAKRLSDEFKLKHSTINWRGWSGLRDRLIHGYDDVDLGIVKNVVTNELPKLITELGEYEKYNK